MSTVSAQNKVKVVSEKNSGKLNLLTGQSFVGSWEDVSDFALITVFVSINIAATSSNPIAESCTLKIESGTDFQGKHTRVRTYIINSTSGLEQAVTVGFKAVRISILANENTSITDGYVQTIYHKHKAPYATSYLGQSLDSTTNAIVVQAAIAGEKPNGTFQNIATDSQGVLQVSIVQGGGGGGGRGNTSPATELVVTNATPLSVAETTGMAEISFPYGINLERTDIKTMGSGAFSLSSFGCGILTTGADMYGNVITNAENEVVVSDIDLCVLETRENIRFNAGYGCRTVLGAVFTDPTHSNITTDMNGTYQYVGVGDATNGLFFGFNGLTFGILQRYGGVLEIRSIVVTGGAYSTGTCILTLNGLSTNISVTSGDSISTILTTIQNTIFVGWSVYTVGSTVYFKSVQSEVKSESFVFSDGGTGVTMSGFVRNIAGNIPTDQWIAQVNWNADPADGSATLPKLRAYNGNVYQIEFNWNGFCMVTFSIYDSTTDQPIVVHTIRYGNNYTIPFVFSQVLPLRACVENLSSPTPNLMVQVSTMSIQNYGTVNIDFSTPFWSYTDLDSFTFRKGVYTSITCLQNNIVFNSVENKSPVHLHSLTMSMFNSVYTNGILNVVFIKNPTFVQSTPVFSSADSNSCMMVSSNTSLEFSGGKTVFMTSLCNTSTIIPLDKYSIFLYPGDTILVAVKPVSALNLAKTNLVVGLQWTEQH